MFELDPGEQGDGEVVVINDGDEPIKVLVYTADQDIDEAGNITYRRSQPGRPDFLPAALVMGAS